MGNTKGYGKPGRNIKREFARTSILHTRIAPEYKDLIAELRKEADNKIISEADIVEFALELYAHRSNFFWNAKTRKWGEPW